MKAASKVRERADEHCAAPVQRQSVSFNIFSPFPRVSRVSVQMKRTKRSEYEGIYGPNPEISCRVARSVMYAAIDRGADSAIL